MARAAAKSGICLIIMAAAVWAAIILPAGQGGSSPWIGLMVLLAVSGLWTALGIMGYAVFTAWDGVWAFTFMLPWPRNSEGDPPRPLAFLLFSSTLIYLLVLLIVVANVIVLWQEKRSSGRPPWHLDLAHTIGTQIRHRPPPNTRSKTFHGESYGV